MSWLGIVIALLCLYAVTKVAGFMIKLVLLAVVVCGLYWFAAPYLAAI